MIAENSHVRRSHPSTNGGRRIFRKGANYETAVGAQVEAGLLFQSYQADLGDQFVPIQRMLDEADELNEWTTATGSAECAILAFHSRGPVSCTDVPNASTATVTGMSCTVNS